MKCKERFFKLIAILIIGFSLVSLSLTTSNTAVNPNKTHFVADSRSVNQGQYLSPEVWKSSDNQTSNPMDRIFQIIFILFFISPPLIVLLLFLIWVELKKRNENK